MSAVPSAPASRAGAVRLEPDALWAQVVRVIGEPVIKGEIVIWVWLVFDALVFTLSTDAVGILPPSTQWFSDGLLGVLIARVGLAAILTWRWKRSTLDLPIVLFVGVILVSSQLNGTDLLSTALATRIYLKYALFYVVLLRLDFSESFYRRFRRWFVGVALLQVPVTAFQFFVLDWRIDEVGGTFGSGGTAFLGFLLVLAECVFITRAIERRRGRVLNLAASALLLVPAALASINQVFLSVPVLAAVAFGRTLLQWNRRAIAVVFTLPVIVAAMWGGLSFFTSLDPDNLAVQVVTYPGVFMEYALSADERDLNADLSINRIVQIPVAFKIAGRDAALLVFGTGPYRYAQSKVLGGAERQQGLVQTGLGGNQVTRTLLELGLLGMLASAVLMVAVWWQIHRAIRRARGTNEAVVGKAVELMWVYFALLAPSNDVVWAMELIAVPFWLWVASLTPRSRAPLAGGTVQG